MGSHIAIKKKSIKLYHRGHADKSPEKKLLVHINPNVILPHLQRPRALAPIRRPIDFSR